MRHASTIDIGDSLLHAALPRSPTIQNTTAFTASASAVYCTNVIAALKNGVALLYNANPKIKNVGIRENTNAFPIMRYCPPAKPAPKMMAMAAPNPAP